MIQQVQKQSITLNNAMTRSDFMIHIDNIATKLTEVIMDNQDEPIYYEDLDGVTCFLPEAQRVYNDLYDILETELVSFGVDVANEQKEICANNAKILCTLENEDFETGGFERKYTVSKSSVLQAPTVEFKEFDSLEDTEKYKYWEENHSDISWEEFNDNYFKCNKCGTYDDLPCEGCTL